jgi:hypothetical protein
MPALKQPSTSSSGTGTLLLREQLFHELQLLTATDDKRPAASDPWRFRAILRQILGEAWSAVARGDFTALRTLLHHLIEGEEIVRADLPDPDPPQVEAAREVRYAAYVLHVAEAFVSLARTGARLRDRQRSEPERKILRVLLKCKDRYLRRGEILDEMSRLLPKPYPDGPRASQILAELYNERVLMRMQGSAQGNSQTSFFSLSQQGLELCAQLGLAEPVRLFESDATKWERCLQARWPADSSDEKQRDERIATFYRPRPGVGCSLALAHCSVVLANQIRKLERRRVLVLDLEGEESSLHDHFGLQAQSCRGLAGLLEDYRRQPGDERRGWLEANLFTDSYACRPRPELDALFYLPPFQRKPGVDLFQIYAALLGDLRVEVEQQPRQEDGAPRFASTGFLGDLRDVLQTDCAKTLIQAPSGLGPGVYLASVLLAEELVIFLHPNDSQREGVQETVREVVGNCLWRDEKADLDRPALSFALSPLPLSKDLDLAARIDHLLLGPGARREGEGFRIVQLHFDPVLAWGNPPRPGDLQGLTSLLADDYQLLVKSLRPDASRVPAPSPNMENPSWAGALLSPAPFHGQTVGASGALAFLGAVATRPGVIPPRPPENDLGPSLQALELVGAWQNE